MKRTFRKGFTLVEMLLSLAICAALFAAISAAVLTASQSVKGNVSQALLGIAGRNALMHLLGQVRNGVEHHPYTQKGAAYTSYVNNGAMMSKDIGICIVSDADGTAITYTYWWDQSDPTNGKILMKREAPGVPATTTTLLEGVTRFEVSMWPGKSQSNRGNLYDIMVRACITLEATETNAAGVQSAVVTLSGSSVPRRNVWSGAHLTFSIDKAIEDKLGMVR